MRTTAAQTAFALSLRHCPAVPLQTFDVGRITAHDIFSRLRWNITLRASATTPTRNKISGRSQESGSNYASIFLWSENVSEASEIARHKKPRRPFFDVLTWNNFGSLDLRRQKTDEERGQARPQEKLFEDVFFYENGRLNKRKQSTFVN